MQILAGFVTSLDEFIQLLRLYYKPFISKALRCGLHVTVGSHSFTCHPHTNRTPHSPAARRHRSLAGTRAYRRRDGQAELASQMAGGYFGM